MIGQKIKQKLKLNLDDIDSQNTPEVEPTEFLSNPIEDHQKSQNYISTNEKPLNKRITNPKHRDQDLDDLHIVDSDMLEEKESSIVINKFEFERNNENE